MGSDRYKVEVLHYLNPHLIWALVEKDGEEGNTRFEQLGIYGILPLNVTIDISGNVETYKSEQWLPAVFVAMKKLFLESSEVWFSVTFSDKTTSIFDDNLHKYGDLTLKMKNGQIVSMHDQLLETGFVAEDVVYFHQNLHTKLNYTSTFAVVNEIKQSLKLLKKSYKLLESVLESQISVFLTTVELEHSSAVRNMSVDMRKHHNKLLLRKQVNDLNACKDVDEKSAGRACRRSVPSNLSAGLIKKINLVKSLSVANADSPNPVENKNADVNTGDSIIEQNEKDYINTLEESSVKKISNKKEKIIKENKRYIAFGPPHMNPTKYHLKEVVTVKYMPVQKQIPVKEDVNPDVNIINRSDSEEHLGRNDLDYLEPKILPYKPNNYIKVNNAVLNNVDKNQDNTKNEVVKKASSVQRKMKFLKEKIARMNDSSSTADTDSVDRPGDDSDCESISALVAKLDLSTSSIKKEVKLVPESSISEVKINVNPFKNLDGSRSVFVEKLVTPTLMVHTKNNNCIKPVSNLRDIPFGSNIHVLLRNMSVKKPMRLQTVLWPVILRGHSVFVVSPNGSGKTLGYLPAVCRLVSDNNNTADNYSIARLTCIIVCATAKSAGHVEEMSKMFLHNARIFACYAGMTDVTISTTILNGCDILICTPIMLVRLIRENLGLDLRNLNTFVIDDCERISEVYQNEIKFCLSNVREMLKSRANKQVKVQYVVASRIWSSFMSSLARKAPDSVVCIGAFQECVLYSESDTSIQFLEKENKIGAVLNFLENIDKSKKTVIACRSDDEVHLVEKALTSLKYVVYACDSTMTVHELYAIDLAFSEFKEPLIGPILVCCDGNLTHLNITDAHYLVHFSLPELFSMFSKRFAVLIDNYSSVFNPKDSGVKIKIFLETSNVEQLPKILHFIKRCSDDIPDVLNQISSTVTLEKDLQKAKAFVPLCNTLLRLGKCADIAYCKERHALFQDFDRPLAWMPKEGTITFKILHYHSPVHYSARLMSCTSNNDVTKYPQTYSMLSIKLGMYYSKEKNRKLHGIAKVGDICAVALKQNLFARCQIAKILKYTQHNLPSVMLINLIDEEKYEMACDTSLYHLPDEFKQIESHVVKVILANIAPQDRDITYSKLAENQLKKITYENDQLFMRGQIVLVIANTIFVETLEACQELSSLNETVVKNNFRNELLDVHAVNNPEHISTLEKLGEHIEFISKKTNIEKVESPKPIKILPKARWAHLESEGYTPVYYLYAKNPSLFFVQHVKFKNCLKTLLSDIQKHVLENPEPAVDIKEGDIVLAEFPDDASYERARIDKVIDNTKVKCFFVDLGDWSIVPVEKVLPVSEKIITQLPFQAIECRLVGIRPVGDEWSEFSTNWLVDQFYDSGTNLKYLFVKRFTKEKSDYTDGDKYGVGLINTYANDVFINKLMIDANLAEENEEIEFLNTIDFEERRKGSCNDNDSVESTDLLEENEMIDNNVETNMPVSNKSDNLKRSIPSYLLSNAKKYDVSKPETTSSNNSSLEEDSDAPVYNIKPTTEILPNKHGCNVEINDFQVSKNNQLALINSSKSALNMKDTSTSDSDNTSEDSKENVINQQQAIMNMLRSKPIRSMPLVSDDIDDDRWDSLNPVQMLMVPPETKSNVNEVPKFMSSSLSTIKAEVYTSPSSENAAITPSSKIINVDESKTKLKTVAEQLKHAINLNKNLKSAHWSVSEKNQTLLLHDDMSTGFQVNWCQDNNNITITILVEENYELVIDDKEIKFLTKVNDIKCGFQFELYGVVNVEKSTHSKKDKYVEIHLRKVMAKNWLSLYKGSVKRCLVDNDNSIEKNMVGEQKTKPEDNLRKPKIVWRQNKSKITIKIMLITEKYNLTVQDKNIKFKAKANDEEYGFEFELYGVVDKNKTCHLNKGQYIQVTLQKVMPHNWLFLGKGYVKKWVVYDVDNIDISSEDESDSTDDAYLRNTLNLNAESESELDFQDDVNFGYK